MVKPHRWLEHPGARQPSLRVLVCIPSSSTPCPAGSTSSSLGSSGSCARGTEMVNGLHLYSAFIQSALQFLPLIHPFTHTFTHQRRLAAMQGTNQLVRSNWGLGVLLRDTSTRPGWDRTGNPPTARRQLYLLSHIARRCPWHCISCSWPLLG